MSSKIQTSNIIKPRIRTLLLPGTNTGYQIPTVFYRANTVISIYRGNSQGTAANGRCCTVTDVGTTSSPAELHPALATPIPTCTVYGDPPVQKLQLSRTAFRPHNLLFFNTNLSTSNPCNSTDFSLYVLTNSQTCVLHHVA